MTDRETLWRFRYAFSWALEALLWETKELWSEQEEIRVWPSMIRDGKPIPGNARIIQDRFTRVFSDYFRHLSDDNEVYFKVQEEVKQKIFSNWKNWRVI